MAVSLSDRLKSFNNNAKSSDWVRFIQDHKEYIKLNSNRRRLNINEISIYKHRIREFITVQQLCSYELVWILFLINDLTVKPTLENKTLLYIPAPAIIDDLRKKHKAFTSKQSL